MSSLRSHEGVMMIDHRYSPGVDDATMVGQGLPAGAGRGLFEAPTFTCSHCEVVVVMNPKRNRERGYCKKCDHLICDNCETRRVASGHECLPYKAMVEQVLNDLAKQPSTAEAFILPNLPPPAPVESPSIIIP